MGFCTKCGRPLKDGEICNCQQTPQPTTATAQPTMTAPQPAMSAPQPTMSAPQGAPQPQMGAVQPQFGPAQPGIGADIAELYKGIFASPVETITKFMAKANIVLIAVLIGAQAIMNALVRLFAMLVKNSHYKQFSTAALFKNMFMEILLVAVTAAVVALIIWLMVRAFDKTDVAYVHGLAAYSVITLLGIPAEFISWILSLISVEFFVALSSCVSIFADVAGYAFLYIAIRSICKNEKNVPLIMAASIVCGHFASWIIGLMF